jgi:arabinofuranan 3-O-arabinosyltransferase
LGSQGISLEAIVVDQESQDATADIAKRAGASVVTTPRPPLYAPPTRSRNLGAKTARGDYLLHLDVDMSLPPAILAEAVRRCTENDHVALVLEEVDVAQGYWAECKALERRTYRGSGLLEAARFVRRGVFDAVGGYDESLGSGEDWDVHLRYTRTGSIGRLPTAVYHHLGWISWRGQVAKKFAYGRSTANFHQKHGVERFSREMIASYRRNWRLFARDPAHAVGFLGLRVSEAGAVAAGLAIESLGGRAS